MLKLFMAILSSAARETAKAQPAAEMENVSKNPGRKK